MSRVCRVLALALLAGWFVGPDVGAGSKLDKDDRRWLDQVAPLITPEETRLFAQVDAGDRERFRQIFWARRDPDPLTSRNELKESFEARRSLANRQFRQAGLAGAMTAMGRVFLLLGPPSHVSHGRIEGGQARIEEEECDTCGVPVENLAALMAGPATGLGATNYVTWTYDPEPRTGIPQGLAVEFRSESAFGYRLVNSDDVERALERARRLCICDAVPGYELDGAGRLAAPPAAARHEGALERALMNAPHPAETEPRVAFRATPAFFAADGDASYVPVLLEIEPHSLTWEDAVAEVTVLGSVDATGGESPETFRLRAGLARDTDGRVRFDIPLVFSPGRHELRLAVQDDASSAVGTSVLDLLVPDYQSGTPIMSSVVAYAEAREVAVSPRTPGHAFQFGRLRVVPRRDFRRDERLGLLFYVYGLGSSPEASPVVRYAVFRDGALTARTPESPLTTSGSEGVGNTEIPLDGFAPGRYSLRVAVTDPGSGTMLTRSIDFRVTEAPP